MDEKKAYALKQLLLLFVLVLPSLVGMKDQVGSTRNLLKSLVQHRHNHTQNRAFKDRIADQIAAMQVKNGR